MITGSDHSVFLYRLKLFFVASLFAVTASADCIKDVRWEVYCGGGRCIVDRAGTVWCSRYYEGGAEITLEGQVLCGKGQCAKDPDGRVLCSSELGGTVLIDSRGHVRCYGKCEAATADMCENTRADDAID
jgi:hypothetical protein